MAPNLNRNAVLLAPQSLPALQTTVFKDYFAPQPALDSTSYWSWPAEVPTVDTFSVDHIVENLVRASTIRNDSNNDEDTTTNPEHDSYWAEESQQQQHEPQAAPRAQQLPSYWDEPCHESTTASDAYWSDAPPRQTKVIEANNNQKYWEESRHERTASDLYWAESTESPAAAARGHYYWSETRHERTAADAYWVW